MSKDDRGDAGRFTETVPAADVLDVFDAVEGPAVTSADVAEALECSTETARRKLRGLEAEGAVASRETAGRVLWWRVERPVGAGSIDPDDAFWTLEPGTSGETDVSASIDDVLYGDR